MYINFENSNKKLKYKFTKAFRKTAGELITKEKINLYAQNNSISFVHADEYFNNDDDTKKKNKIHAEDIEPELIKPFIELHKNKTIVIFIDYIQLIDARDTKVTGYEKIKYISGILKRISTTKDQEIIVITGAQENKDGGLREADDIKQSADNIINLYNIQSAEAEEDTKVRKKTITKYVQDFSDEIKTKEKQVMLWSVVKGRDGHFKGKLDDILVLDGDNVQAYKFKSGTYIPEEDTPMHNQQNTDALYQANQAVELEKEDKVRF